MYLGVFLSLCCVCEYVDVCVFSCFNQVRMVLRDIPVSRGQILRRERGQGNIHFPCSADDEQDWQPYSVDPYSCFM